MPFKILTVLALLSLPLIPTIWAILDIPKRRFPTPKKKVVWFLVVSTLPFLGAMFYITFARRHTEPIEIP